MTRLPAPDSDGAGFVEVLSTVSHELRSDRATSDRAAPRRDLGAQPPPRAGDDLEDSGVAWTVCSVPIGKHVAPLDGVPHQPSAIERLQSSVCRDGCDLTR
jgi:hypothetical protein